MTQLRPISHIYRYIYTNLEYSVRNLASNSRRRILLAIISSQMWESLTRIIYQQEEQDEDPEIILTDKTIPIMPIAA